jgi:hypothetical protein
MTENKSISQEEAVIEMQSNFDRLKEQAKDGHSPLYLVYTGDVGAVVHPKTWVMRDVLGQRTILGKSIAMVPAPEERTLYILEYETGAKLGEITNPPLDLLNELTGLTT